MPRVFTEISETVSALLLVIGDGDLALAPAFGFVEDGQETYRSGSFRHVATHTLLHTAAVAVRRPSTIKGTKRTLI